MSGVINSPFSKIESNLSLECLASCTTITHVIGSVILGIMAGTLGRKIATLYSLLLTLISWVILGLSDGNYSGRFFKVEWMNDNFNFSTQGYANFLSWLQNIEKMQCYAITKVATLCQVIVKLKNEERIENCYLAASREDSQPWGLNGATKQVGKTGV